MPGNGLYIFGMTAKYHTYSSHAWYVCGKQGDILLSGYFTWRMVTKDVRCYLGLGTKLGQSSNRDTVMHSGNLHIFFPFFLKIVQFTTEITSQNK